MKTTTFQKTNLVVLILLFIFSTIDVNAQVAVNSSGTPPNASAMLDVSSANQGVLIPRVAWGSVTTPVQGLLVYFNAGAPGGNGFYYYDSGWKRLSDGSGILAVTAGGTGTGTQFTTGSVVFAGTGGVYTEDNANFFWDDANDRLALGPATPATRLHVVETSRPAILIAHQGPNDASLQYYLNSGSITTMSSGIDNDDNHNFKISKAATLLGTTYIEPSTMFRIHTEQGSEGITDINHQSRARAFLTIPQIIPQAVWIAIEFDMTSYDEHGEFMPGVPNAGIPGQFVARQDGYYQVNARAEFAPLDQILGQGYVSIAIFKNGLPYAVGNNLQMTDMFGEELMEKNNAPNVSDVLDLVTGDIIEIYVFQTFSTPNAILKVTDMTLPPPQTPAITYVSIHKVS